MGVGVGPNLYKLQVTLAWTHHSHFGGVFEFIAADDDEARALVKAFARVCQPGTYGPLDCVGETETRDGITAVWRRDDESEHRMVPMEIVELA